MVDDFKPMRRANEETRRPDTGTRISLRIDRGLERADDGRAHRNHGPTLGARPVDGRHGGFGDLVGFFVHFVVVEAVRLHRAERAGTHVQCHVGGPVPGLFEGAQAVFR